MSSVNRIRRLEFSNEREEFTRCKVRKGEFPGKITGRKYIKRQRWRELWRRRYRVILEDGFGEQICFIGSQIFRPVSILRYLCSSAAEEDEDVGVCVGVCVLLCSAVLVRLRVKR